MKCYLDASCRLCIKRHEAGREINTGAIKSFFFTFWFRCQNLKVAVNVYNLKFDSQVILERRHAIKDKSDHCIRLDAHAILIQPTNSSSEVITTQQYLFCIVWKRRNRMEDRLTATQRNKLTIQLWRIFSKFSHGEAQNNYFEHLLLTSCESFVV